MESNWKYKIMIKRPNAILTNRTDSNNKRWNVVYIRLEDGSWTHSGQEYIKTDNPLNLDPFVNWLDWIPDKEWVHPVIAKSDGNGGWYMKGFDTFNEARFNDKSVTLQEIYDKGVLFLFFGKLLDHYKNKTDEEILEILNIGRIDKWTMEVAEKV